MFKKNPIEDLLKIEQEKIALLPLRDIVIFPGMVVPLFIGREKSINALKYALSEGKEVFLVAQKNAIMDEPRQKDLYSYGTIGTVLQLLKMPDGTVKSLIEGKERAKIKTFINNSDFMMAEIDKIEEQYVPDSRIDALMRNIQSSFKSYAELNQKVGNDVAQSIAAINDPIRIINSIAAHLSVKVKEKQSLLEIEDTSSRLEKLYQILISEIDILELEESLRQRVKKQMEKTQKNYYLNEQMRAIQKEMGAQDDFASELKELERKIKNKNLPKEASLKVRHELKN